ncbi:MAG: acetyl-CoA synthase subunit gamma [Deltaproteobacteria bacterium]|nr:acetyl-CoA synthase subunit gamma [Deltaproteobacteria bacterium]MBW2594910.1 acetyl-CoA synthase subunit gamma [Deltaproteobacteria bacterium]MBW2650320.1 acetyl-CoA synthase subunit gamma [Deltaproteobacteria bacterium]
MDQPFVIGAIETDIDRVPQVSSVLQWPDHWGTIKARSGINRMLYAVDPGLYALGNPDAESPVLVTANYKLSFDSLRAALPGRDAWILVLDTEGINVWCAAGKGTFGTAELVARIKSSRIGQIVSHRKIILPQLGAPGVAAHVVKKLAGFTVHYGPIRAEDLAEYLDHGMVATPAMRLKTFTFSERAILIPIELAQALKVALIVALVALVISGLGGPGTYVNNIITYGIFFAVALFSGVLAGAVLTPLLLPYIPGRAFALKGLVLGLIAAVVLVFFRNPDMARWADRLEILAWFLLVPALAAFLAMNFTGASTYTSLSGVKKEMRWALPLEITAGGAGCLLWLGSRFIV